MGFPLVQLVKNPLAMLEMSRRTWSHLLLWKSPNYNLLLNNHWQENVGSHQEKIPHAQWQRRNSSKMVGGAKLHLESNPITTRDTWRAQTTLSVHQETLQRLRQTCFWVFECLSVSCGGMGQQWPASGAGALGAAILVVASGFFEEFTINPTMQFPSRWPINCRTIIPNKFLHC